MWKLKPCATVIDLDIECSEQKDVGNVTKEEKKTTSMLVKLEKSKLIHKKPINKKAVIQGDKEKRPLFTAAPAAASNRGACLRDHWAPHQGHGLCRNPACIFGEFGKAATAGPAGLCDLCNFSDMKELLEHGQGRLTHLLLELPETESNIALSRIKHEVGESFVQELRSRMQRARARKRADRPRRGPRGPYKKVTP
ncbi:pif1 [Symbiodinium sp. CCMP2592]|nr:pif1 [Symbiodinium sp. CCMP2592]